MLKSLIDEIERHRSETHRSLDALADAVGKLREEADARYDALVAQVRSVIGEQSGESNAPKARRVPRFEERPSVVRAVGEALDK